MNIWKYMKSNKVFFLLSLGAAILGTIASLFFGGCSRKGEKSRVIVSKRVKIDIQAPGKGREEKAAGEVTKKSASWVWEKKKGKAPKAVKMASRGTAAKRTTARSSGKKAVPEKRDLKKAVKTLKPWAVNVASFTRLSDARRLDRKLSSKGYNSYITEFTKGSTLYYRVRVGFYSTRDRASRTGKTIASTYRNVGTPWVVKPGMEEVVSHIE